MGRRLAAGTDRLLRALVGCLFAFALLAPREGRAAERVHEIAAWAVCEGSLEDCTAQGAPRLPLGGVEETPVWSPLRGGAFTVTWHASFPGDASRSSHVVIPGEMNAYRALLRCASTGAVVGPSTSLRIRTALTIGPCEGPVELAVEVGSGVAWRRWPVRAFVGPREELFVLQRLGETAPLLLIGALVFFAVVQLVLALEPRGRTGALLTGLLALLSAMRVYAVSDDWGLWIGEGNAVASVRLIYGTPAAATFVGAAFYRWAARQPASPLWRANGALAACIVAFAAIYEPATVEQLVLVRALLVTILCSLAFCVHAIAVLCRNVGRDDRTVVITGALFVVFGVGADVTRTFFGLTDWAGLGFGSIGLLFEILSQSVLVARRNARAHDAVDALAASLEEKNVALAKTNEALEREVDGHRRVAAELAVSQQRLALGENMATLGMLMADIAHDLRNPIHYVRTAAEMLEENTSLLPESTPVEAKRRKAILDATSWIRTGTSAMEAISRAMRNQSRNGGTCEPFSLPEVTREALLLCRSRTKLHAVEVDVDDAEVTLDPTGYGQLLMNLLSNAADALVEHGEGRSGFAGTIHVQITHTGSSVRVVVEDNGPGIPDAVAERILEPFFTTKPRGQGTGLGLAIVQRVVRAHEGSLTIGRSPTLGGARFEAVLEEGRA